VERHGPFAAENGVEALQSWQTTSADWLHAWRGWEPGKQVLQGTHERVLSELNSKFPFVSRFRV